MMGRDAMERVLAHHETEGYTEWSGGDAAEARAWLAAREAECNALRVEVERKDALIADNVIGMSKRDSRIAKLEAEVERMRAVVEAAKQVAAICAAGNTPVVSVAFLCAEVSQLEIHNAEK